MVAAQHVVPAHTNRTRSRWRSSQAHTAGSWNGRPGGGEYEVGRITLWDPPAELAFQWRPASFSAEQTTEVHVRFQAVDDGTRVVVEHTGWDAIAPKHAARHGFPLAAFLAREAEWWQALLRSLQSRV